MTVEEVARLATRFGWSYEALMSMTLPERRLWLAAADAVRAGTGSRPGHAAPVPAAPVAPAAPGTAVAAAPRQAEPRLTTEEERRARLYQMLQEFRKEREGT